jgi:hypothetical protein
MPLREELYASYVTDLLSGIKIKPENQGYVNLFRIYTNLKWYNPDSVYVTSDIPIRRGHLRIVKMLYNRAGDNTKHIFTAAISYRHINVIMFLVKNIPESMINLHYRYLIYSILKNLLKYKPDLVAQNTLHESLFTILSTKPFNKRHAYFIR